MAEPVQFESWKKIIANALEKQASIAKLTPKMKRKTTQRKTIEQVFLQEDGPLGAEEVLAAARKAVDSLNQSTVYRNLKLLMQKGWLRKINHPVRGPLYEKTDTEHHHHFHCRSCNKVYELSGCALDEKASTPQGFVTENHQVFLFGLCAECKTSNGDDRDSAHRPET